MRLTMRCPTCQDLFGRLLDGADAGASAALDAHQPACPEGAAGADAARRLADALGRLTPPAPPPGLAARLTAAVCAEARARPRARRWRAARAAVAAGLAVAAGVLLVVALRSFRTAPPPAPGTPEVAEHTGTDPDGPPVPLRQSMAEAGSAVASLTARTADATVGETAALLPAVTPPALDGFELDEPLEPPTRPFRAAGAGVSAGLEPVTDSARRAVGMFLRDLPVVPGAAGKPG